MTRLALLFFLAHQVLAQSASATQADTSAPTSEAPKYNGGEDNPQDPSDAGAEGASKGAFDLSNGGLAAIIIVCVLVVVLGVGSAILFWIAKKRQWDVRQSLRRASRRMTGRSTADLPSTRRENRRTGIRLDAAPPPRNARQQQQRPNQERDVEKALEGGRGKNTTKITSTFDVDTPTPKTKGWTGGLMGKKR
ncbi:hypothetical protein P280DRAFT_398191 [Massarina eburnea CBS 473.64]|uniref:Mid2 domain-containing protein n=1 Tax=Massarina eburnea CBS 473.64 TaxID=1395130 RepID=A0A6A6S148_9PLEO|nr:hypothetical protein P280DRAFT_398191 [Massarina eburnea CBS 473.64]